MEKNEKKDRLLESLDKGVTMVHLDARRSGVVVPEKFRDQAHLMLNLSYRFVPPDLSVNEWGIRSTLQFSGSPFTVAIPWSALFAVTSDVSKEFWIFPDDMPTEILKNAGDAERESQTVAPGKTHKPVLREVPALSKDSPLDEPPSSEPPRRGHLRLVK